MVDAAMASIEVRSLIHFCNSLSLLCTKKSFEAILKEVVNGKRLSASKVTNLTDIALKIMEVRDKNSLIFM